MEPTDANLARRWQRGDGTAAATVVTRYTDALGAVAFAVLGDFSLAEEAVQETYARAAKRIDQLKKPERLGAWLMGIARHVALDALRQRKREVPLTANAYRARGHPALHAARTELAERLYTAIAGLPENQRDLFAMKYVAGMSYAEIGRVLDMTPEAVGQKLWRIRKKLQDKLKEFRS